MKSIRTLRESLKKDPKYSNLPYIHLLLTREQAMDPSFGLSSDSVTYQYHLDEPKTGKNGDLSFIVSVEDHDIGYVTEKRDNSTFKVATAARNAISPNIDCGAKFKEALDMAVKKYTLKKLDQVVAQQKSQAKALAK